MHSDFVRDHVDMNLKLKTLEKHIGEVHRSVQILRDKQELAETHKELAKLQLAQKESANSSQSQQNEERPSTPVIKPQKMPDPSNAHNQHLALALPHQMPPSQPSLPPRTMDPSRPAVPPAQPQPLNITQQQQYYLPPTQMPAQAQAPQGQGQYTMLDSQYRQSQLQDMSRVPPQPLQTNVSQTPPQSQAHQFPQYQHQWPQQLAQQHLQPTPQPQPPIQSQQQPPNPTHIRPQSGPVHQSYQTSQLTSPAPPDTIPSSMGMQMQFSAFPQSGISRGETVPYGYGGRPIQQQPPQQMKGNSGALPNDGYTGMGSSHPDLTPANSYMMYGNEEGRPHPPTPQPHFSQGGYPAAPQTPLARTPNQSQFVRNHPYSDLVEKLVNMGFRGDHVNNVIQVMEDSGQPIDFNAVLDTLSAQSSASSHRGGWSG
uniref:DUF1421 domain-containing protein n=1 Tax=Kalanchoe fedtschenkoi TaxID=63787 RepID=A0A7N0ZY62_KALFE